MLVTVLASLLNTGKLKIKFLSSLCGMCKVNDFVANDLNAFSSDTSHFLS